MLNIVQTNDVLDYHLTMRYYRSNYSRIATFSIECGLLLLTILNMIAVSYFLKKHKTLHPNFRILCLNDCIGNMVMIALRIFMILDNNILSIQNLTSIKFYKVIHCLYAGISQHLIVSLIFIFLERWWSTTHASNYEYSFNPIFLGIIIGIMWLICFGIGYSSAAFGNNMFFIFILVIHFMALIGFIILLFHNKKLLLHQIPSTISFTFQVKENVKTVKLMFVTGCLVTLHSIIMSIFGFIANSYDCNLTTIETFMFWKDIMGILYALRLFILPNTVLWFFIKKATAIASAPNIYANNNGVIDERTIYFNQLRQQWGVNSER